MTMKALLGTLLCAGWLLQGVAPAQAQPESYPKQQSIKLIIPFPPGGVVDGIARIISDRLAKVLDQTVVIDNRGGASGTIGARFVAAATPDGYTLLLTTNGRLTAAPAIYRNLGYDPKSSFAPVAQIVEMPLIIAVNPALPVRSMAELVAYAKAHPGAVSLGSQGVGSTTHLLLELFKLEAGIDIAHIPYRGTAPMLTAALAGDVQVIVDGTTTSLPHIEAGKLRPLAIVGTRRTPALPDVPTVREAGYPYLETPFWLAVVSPGQTPRDIITRLNAAFRESLSPPETRDRLAALGADIKIGTPGDLEKLIVEELALWTRVANAVKLTVD